MITKPLLRDAITDALRAFATERRGSRLVRIEPEREMAVRFQVSRLSLRVAIKNLVDEGLLIRKQGSGTYIVPRTSLDTVHLLAAADIKPQDPFYNEFLGELSRHLAREAIHLRVIHPETENVPASDCPLVIVGLLDQAILAALQKRYRLIVSTQSYPDALDISQVTFDDHRIGHQAGRVLAESGHGHVVHMSGPAIYPSAAERKRGLVDGLEGRGVAMTVIEGKMNWSSGYGLAEQLVRLLDGGATKTAVFAANDWMALGLMQGLAERRVRVPDDVSVIGCDDIHLATEVTPNLATFRWDMRYLISEVFTVINAMTVDPLGPHKRILLPAEFVRRGSLAAAR